ncbi:MAG: hypothetical protein V4570_06905 [Pseudomonadota bacterium]
MKKLLTFLALLSAASTVSANLLHNGTYEDTIQYNDAWHAYNCINGWSTVISTNIEVSDNIKAIISHDVNSVESDSYNRKTRFQKFTPANGCLYPLLLDHSSRFNQPFISHGNAFSWHRPLLKEITGTGGVINLWITQQFFVTGAGSDVLGFAAIGTNDSVGGDIDYVQPNSVPTPAAAWLFASMLGLFGFARRGTV